MEKSDKNKSLSTEPYKGVRDFYPPDMFIQNHIFGTMKEIAESYGYAEYGASILEPADLYRAKSGEEIVRDQTYSFKDRGERDVTLRPEMTPTVARMVARSRQDLSLPIRWYSIPNLFRYESPQKGRLREHWQLNVDIFGVKNIAAEVEIITIAHKLMRKFGAKDEQFVIIINNRKIIERIYDYFELSEPESYSVSKIIDKKEKINRDEFVRQIREIFGDETELFIKIIGSQTIEELETNLPEEIEKGGLAEIKTLLIDLAASGVSNIRFSPTLMRGFDYYTGIVFEVFDSGTENRRSLFGGGRYDDLLDIFGAEKVTAVGFGMGDVTIRDFLETYKLLPEYKPATDLYLCHAGEVDLKAIFALAEKLRERQLRVAVDPIDRKLGDQIKAADRQRIPFVICVGDEELKTGIFKVKELSSGAETPAKLEEIKKIISK